MELSPVQVRVLGCLIEKERTTPDSYPLTMNALLAACNQTTNRHPIVALTEATVASAVENLRAADLVRVDYSRSNRAEKYRQVLDRASRLDGAEISVLGVLMLRGPQTAAELRTRTERLHAFADPSGVDAVLARLAERPEPLVVRLGRGVGQKEPRWAHLLAGPPEFDEGPPSSEPTRSPRAERLEALEASVAGLTRELEQLRAEHAALAALVRDLVG
ncbi:MAG: DUF480 domain-containing protein [Actinobacteria bacterium]|nr:MAG: DUF480 domain-containing protein [Actinomycetota bacterium]